MGRQLVNRDWLSYERSIQRQRMIRRRKLRAMVVNGVLATLVGFVIAVTVYGFWHRW